MQRNATGRGGQNRLIRSRGDRVFDAVNLFLLTLVLLAVLYPLAYVVSASFSDPLRVLRGEMWLLPVGASLEAYRSVFAHADIMLGYRNTIFYAASGTVITLVLSVCAAYPLTKKDMWGRNFVVGLMTVTMFFSGGLIPTYMVYQQLGLINSVWVLLIPGCISVYNVVVIRTFFQSTIPKELEESAYLDGCGNLRTLLTIVLPLSKAIIAVMALYSVVGHWNAYFSALIYITDRDKYPLQLFLREILVMDQGREQMQALQDDSLVNQMLRGEAIKYAVIIVANLPVMLMYPFIQKYFVKGIMIGSIKG